MRKQITWLLNRFDANRAVQAQKMARGWKFGMYKVEELYYPCSENKGADQLRSYQLGKLRFYLLFNGRNNFQFIVQDVDL